MLVNLSGAAQNRLRPFTTRWYERKVMHLVYGISSQKKIKSEGSEEYRKHLSQSHLHVNICGSYSSVVLLLDVTVQ